MKRWLSIFLCLILMGLLFTGCTNEDTTLPFSNNKLTTSEKLEDFEYLYKVIRDNYPLLHLSDNINESEWINNKSSFKELIKSTKNNDDFFNVLNTILNSLDNSKVHMVSKDQLTMLKSQYDRYLYNGANNTWLAETVNDSKVLERYYPLGSYEKPVIPSNEDKKNDVPNVITKDIISNSIGYIAIKDFINSYNMQEDIDVIDEYLENIKNYDALVIDLRGNKGTENIYWRNYLMPKLINSAVESPTYSFFRDGKLTKNILKSHTGNLVNVPRIRDLNYSDFPNLPRSIFNDFHYYLKEDNKMEPRKSIKFHGRIYLLVDKEVANAAENFSIFAKSTGFATIIGETTSGKNI
ncbi:MAG: S41 family peptidase, partial [Sarcina sp.]